MRPAAAQPKWLETRPGKSLKDLARRCRLSPRAESGVALVITLILLSVITFMAVTLLVVNRSQKGLVNTSTDYIIANEGASSANDLAISQILAPIQIGGSK